MTKTRTVDYVWMFPLAVAILLLGMWWQAIAFAYAWNLLAVPLWKFPVMTVGMSFAAMVLYSGVRTAKSQIKNEFRENGWLIAQLMFRPIITMALAKLTALLVL